MTLDYLRDELSRLTSERLPLVLKDRDNWISPKERLRLSHLNYQIQAIWVEMDLIEFSQEPKLNQSDFL